MSYIPPNNSYIDVDNNTTDQIYGNRRQIAVGNNARATDAGAGNAYTIQVVGASSVVNGSYTLVSTSRSGLYANATTATVAFTLPDAASNIDKIFIFKKADSSGNNVTITRAGSDTLDGSTSITLSTQYDWVAIQSDGTAVWKVWGRTVPASGIPSAAAEFLTLATDTSLSAERVFTPGINFKATDGGANGNYTLQIYASTSISATNTLSSTTVETILCDATGGSFTVTLCAASNTDKRFNIKRIDSNNAAAVTIQRGGSDTIDGATSTSLAVPKQSATVQADGGTSWAIL